MLTKQLKKDDCELKKIKLLIMNLPSGDEATDYPPVAISRVIESVDTDLNCDFLFINLDLERLTFPKLIAKIIKYQPTVIAISGILTPTYKYLKDLSKELKGHFPNVPQILGGEMVVLACIILLKTEIDFCITGESEPTFSKLLQYIKSDQNEIELDNIDGLAYLKKGIPYANNYAKKGEIVRQVNYELLSNYTDINHYIRTISNGFFINRTSHINGLNEIIYPHNLNKQIMHVFASQGCVGKCTFCHRFFKGYEVFNVSLLIEYLRNMQKKYNIGIFLFNEENFGSNKQKTKELVRYLKEAKLNWAAPATRADSIDETIIQEWKEAGCININFGIESGSQKILDVMEKKTTVEKNIEAIKLCYKYNIFTIINIIAGMPGETDETIEETISMLKKALPDNIKLPYEISVNFFQAVPGTPAYEYARTKGYIGASLEEEEKYVESLYKVNANSIKHYLNFTIHSKEDIAYWKYYIIYEAKAAYIKKHTLLKILKYQTNKRYFIRLYIYLLIPKNIRKHLLRLIVIYKDFGLKRMLSNIFRFVQKDENIDKNEDINISLRKIVEKMEIKAVDYDKYTFHLRNGR